tara:strand:+ start:259 stop:477 length:219 start_codon:yes stop_codon:yes gene_type:complete
VYGGCPLRRLFVQKFSLFTQLLLLCFFIPRPSKYSTQHTFRFSQKSPHHKKKKEEEEETEEEVKEEEETEEK